MKKRLLTSLLTLSVLAAPAFAAPKPIKVISSLAPIHSLVSQVLDGTGENLLLVPTTQSPHGFQLRPSHLRELKAADLVFWVGPGLETFLDKPLDQMENKSVELMDIEGLKILDLREGGIWAAHDHDHDHDADHKEDHDKDHKEDHKHEAHKDEDHKDHKDHDAHKHEEHAHDEGDPHIWLDIDNAVKMIEAISASLSETYPDYADKFKANAARAIERVTANDKARHEKLHDVDEKPFVVFHDAYQYFEKSHHLKGVGSILLRPNEGASAKRLAEIRDLIKERGAVCIFREPQFPEKLVQTVIHGSDVRSGILDPLGQGLEPGPGLYDRMLDNLAGSLLDCLNK